jgi:hypothetical protein
LKRRCISGWKSRGGTKPTAARHFWIVATINWIDPRMPEMIKSVAMPRRELRLSQQVEKWLVELAGKLTQPGEMILIGSGGLLWHAAQRGIFEPLPENSMDVDPITDSDEIAELCYNAMIGSEFEQQHGWHVNLMPASVLREFPEDWRQRAESKQYGNLRLIVPSVPDLLAPKRRRNEPRDRAHQNWSEKIGLL